MGYGPGILTEPGQDEWCLVCGGPCHAPNPVCEAENADSEEEFAAVCSALAGLEWLNTFVGILQTEEVVSLDGFDDHGGFGVVGRSLEFLTPFQLTYADLEEGQYTGVACHEKCHKVLQRDLGYTLRFQDVWPMLMGVNHDGYNSFTWNGYGGIALYYGEFVPFDYLKIVADGNTWMLQDPMTNEKNAHRIVETWRTLMQNGFTLPEEYAATDPVEMQCEDVNDPQAELAQDFASISLSVNPQTSSHV